MGDSILDWNAETCRSVPDVLAREHGKRVLSRAVSGAQVLAQREGRPAIPDQYQAGDWAWVVLDGGANDLNVECACDKCDGVLDRLVTRDLLAGEMVALLDRLVGDGARVLLLTYYRFPRGGQYTPFAECPEEFDELNDRYRRLAEARRGVFLLDLRDVLSPETTSDAYALDQLHPNAHGGELIAAAVARALADH
jgi:lysophospholipase L1-like esterase